MQITTPRQQDQNNARNAGLQMLVEAATTRPLNESKLEAARQSLAQGEGEATVVEASAVIGSMDIFTKITQGTGRPALPNFMTKMMRFVFGIIRFLYELFF